MARVKPKGYRFRACCVCGSPRRLYCSTPIVDKVRVKNSMVEGAFVIVDAGDVVCDRCIEASHPEVGRLCKQLPVAQSEKTCHRCGGAGRVRPPGRCATRRRDRDWWRCPKCNGAGKVAA